MVEQEKILKCEERFLEMFTKHFRFSNNLTRYYDRNLEEMYDHNFFDFTKNVDIQELIQALIYQREKKQDFLKFISINRLNKKLVGTMTLDETVNLTMVHNNKTKIVSNDDITIKNVNIKDLDKIELKHYTKLYGKKFIQKRNKEFMDVVKKNDRFKYLGAYYKGKIVGVCHTFTHGDYTCIDSLLVDEKMRNKHVASTLVAHAKEFSEYLYLHVYEDDKAKALYKKLGFKPVFKTYEYFRNVNN